MPMFRKKPIEVQARKLTPDHVEDIAHWCGGLQVEEIDALEPDKKWVGINVPTLEGVMRASEGDWIIQGVKGEFYPCKSEIFLMSYDPAV